MCSFDMVLVKAEEKHAPWETAFPIWNLLGGSQLLEKGFEVLVSA